MSYNQETTSSSGGYTTNTASQFNRQSPNQSWSQKIKDKLSKLKEKGVSLKNHLKSKLESQRKTDYISGSAKEPTYDVSSSAKKTTETRTI